MVRKKVMGSGSQDLRHNMKNCSIRKPMSACDVHLEDRYKANFACGNVSVVDCECDMKKIWRPRTCKQPE